MTERPEPKKKRKPMCEVPEGKEIRGFMIKLYPTKEEEISLLSLLEPQRFIWNTIIRQSDDTYLARESWAVRNKIVEPFVKWEEFAKDNGLDPENGTKDVWRYYCKDRSHAINKAAKDIPGLQPRKLKEWIENFGLRHDYQFFKKILTWKQETENDPKLGAALLQGLGKSFYSKGVKRRRKRATDMCLYVRTGKCFELGEFKRQFTYTIANNNHQSEGRGRRGNNYYNCRIIINGIKVLGRLPGKPPTGRIVEGVSVSRKADGWWASIKEVVDKHVVPVAESGTSVGIDVGLVDLAVLSDGTIIKNYRGAGYVEKIAGMQATGRDPSRIQLAASRRAKQQCYELAKYCYRYETVAVEKLVKTIGQMGSAKMSNMRMVVDILKYRLGDRVREVDCRYTSQDCSQCGFRSKDTWAFNQGRVGYCPSCGHSEHRDLNAARNVLRKYTDSLAA